MDRVHRAKIFAPFDALAGFDTRIKGKEVSYCERRELSETEKEELDRKVSVLRSLTVNSRTARSNRPVISVTYFSPCMDIENDWYGVGGRYKTVTGVVYKVDEIIGRSITVDDMEIKLEDVVEISRAPVENVI